LLTFSLSIVIAAYLLWVCPPPPGVREGFWGHLADILDYVLPDFFGGLIEFAVVQHYYLFIGTTIAIYAYGKIRGWCRNKTVDACERLRHLIILDEVEDSA